MSILSYIFLICIKLNAQQFPEYLIKSVGSDGKEHFLKYDKNGNYIGSGSPLLEGQSGITFKFDDSNRILEYNMIDYDTSLKTHYISDQLLYSYDGNIRTCYGREVQLPDTALVFYIKREDSIVNQRIFLSKYFAYINGGFKYEARQDYNYDQNKLLSVIDLDLNNGKHDTTNVFEYRYDANGNNIQTINYSYKIGKKMMTKTRKYAYDNQSRLISDININYDNLGNLKDTSLHRFVIYNNQNSSIETSWYRQDYKNRSIIEMLGLGQNILEYKVTNFSNNLESTKSKIIYHRDSKVLNKNIGNQLQNYNRINFVDPYSDNTYIFLDDERYKYKILAIEAFKWDNQNSKWTSNGLDSFYYSSSLTKLDNNKYALKFNLFPNPAKDLINIVTTNNEKLLSCEVYDLMGNQLLVLYEKELNVSSLPNGLYFMRVNLQGGSFFCKFEKI